MRVLLTGAAGFIGSSVAEALLSRGDSVVGVDNFNDFYDPAIKEQNIREVGQKGPGTFTLVRADLLDPDRMASLFDSPPDVICHLAAWAGVRPSIENPMIYQSTNVEGTMRLLELARKHDVKPFVFASSSSVYGARRKIPFSETDPVDDPISPYAATKKAGELLGYTYHHLFGLHFLGLRFFTVYGPRQRPEMAIHLFTRNILEGRPIRLFGDGSSARDYTYIDDTVSGVLAAIDRACQTPGYRIYNLGRSDHTTLSDLVALIEKVTNKKANLSRIPDQPGDVPLTCANIQRAKEELGYAPAVPIAEGIERFVAWYLSHQQ